MCRAHARPGDGVTTQDKARLPREGPVVCGCHVQAQDEETGPHWRLFSSAQDTQDANALGFLQDTEVILSRQLSVK